MTWRRPDGEFPRIWLKENGFVIRDVTPDIEPYVLEHSALTFCGDEPLHKSLNAVTCTQHLLEAKRVWREIFIPQRVSIAAVAEGEPGADLKPVDPANPPLILGANLLKVIHKDDPPSATYDELFTTHVGRAIYGTTMGVGLLVNCFEQYGVDCYMNSAALTVCPSVRGKGLGHMLLRTRIAMCRAFDVPVTKTVFTNIGSQLLAEKTGFKKLAEVDPTILRNEDGTVMFPGLKNSKSVQLHAFFTRECNGGEPIK